MQCTGTLARIVFAVVAWSALSVNGAPQSREPREPFDRNARTDHGERIFFPLFRLDEIVLTGISKTPKGYIAVFEAGLGPNPLTFFTKVGDRFLDGKIQAIGGSSVTVEQVEQDFNTLCCDSAPKDRPKEKRRGLTKVLVVGAKHESWEASPNPPKR